MHHDLIKQLHIFRREHGGKANNIVALRQIIRHSRGHGLRNRNAIQQRAKILQGAAPGKAARCHLIGNIEQGFGVVYRQRIQHPHQVRLIKRAQHALHCIQSDCACSIGDRLIGERQGIAHRALRTLRE